MESWNEMNTGYKLLGIIGLCFFLYVFGSIFFHAIMNKYDSDDPIREVIESNADSEIARGKADPEYVKNNAWLFEQIKEITGKTVND